MAFKDTSLIIAYVRVKIGEKVHASARTTARFSAVCPPIVGSSASGFSYGSRETTASSGLQSPAHSSNDVFHQFRCHWPNVCPVGRVRVGHYGGL